MSVAATGSALDAAIRRRLDDAFALLERLVRHASEVGSEAGVLAELTDELTRLGLRTTRLPIPAAIADDPAAGVPQLPYDGGRGPVVGRLAAVRPAERARSLLLNGHLDVVPAGDPAAWNGDPWSPRIEDGWMIARGAGDMKGGVAMATLATGALLDVLGDQLAGDLTIVGTIEEECTGNGTLAPVRDGVLADAVVIPESTGMDLLHSGVGVLWIDLLVRTPGGHAEASRSQPGAAEAAGELVRLAGAIEKRLARDHPPADGAPPYRVNVGTVAAGEWISSAPTSARLGVRVGYPRGWTSADAFGWVETTVRELAQASPALSDGAVEIRPCGMRAEGYALPGDSELVHRLRTAHRDAHADAPAPALLPSGATTDARFYLNQAGVPAVCFGPRARGLHAAEEAVELASIEQGARTLSRFMAAWLTATDPQEST